MLRRQAAHCTACPLYRNATQTVFGEGAASARIMLIGEQPGDREDVEGLPFVGPAGQLLDRALQDARIERSNCYITNAVKHFRWEPRGKRRLHKTPAQREVDACRRWLIAELQAVQPAVLVCLGATAAKAVLGPEVRVTRERGRILASPLGPDTVVTTHPSAVLRIADAARRSQAFVTLVADLRLARQASGRTRRTGASA